VGDGAEGTTAEDEDTGYGEEEAVAAMGLKAATAVERPEMAGAPESTETELLVADEENFGIVPPLGPASGEVQARERERKGRGDTRLERATHSRGIQVVEDRTQIGARGTV
jgi:hypothetical protein